MYMQAAPEGSTISRFETYKQVQKSTGVEPKDLQSRPPFRAILQKAWDVFSELSDYSYQELDAYSRLTGNELEWWEVSAVMRLSLFRGVTPTWPLKPLH